AAIIVEPIQGTAGNVVPPPGYLRALRLLADELGALLICDEMITGFGRTGKMFAIEHEDVIPDVITIGKGFGGGFPMSGIIAREELAFAKPFANPSGSSSSYGGNPLAAAAARITVETIIEDGLVEHSRRLGAKMLAELRRWESELPIVSDVRGRGLMIGLDLVVPGTRKLLDKKTTRWIFDTLLSRGVLAMIYNPEVRINPPLVIVSDVFDSADGQLARLRGTSTRFGRALDGINDNLRFVNLYVHLMYRLMQGGVWWSGILLVALAGLAHTYQSAAVDFIRNAFLDLGTGKAGELDLPEDLEAGSAGTVLERFGARVYRDYVVRQSQLFPRSVKLLRLLRAGGAGGRSVPPAFREEYRERQEVLLPLCSWLGQNIRFLLLGAAAGAGHISAFLWAEAVPMSLLLVVLLLMHEWNATALSD